MDNTSEANCHRFACFDFKTDTAFAGDSAGAVFFNLFKSNFYDKDTRGAD